MYDGDIFKALQAYHSGPGNVASGHIGPKGRAYVGRVNELYTQYSGGKSLYDAYKTTGPGIEGLPELIKKVSGLIDVLKTKQGNLPVRRK